MDCSTTEEINSSENININDDHLLPSNDSSTGRVISVCEIQPSFYLTTPIRRLFDPSNDQSTPNDIKIQILLHHYSMIIQIMMMKIIKKILIIHQH
jgi:hypothetical protein